MRSFQDKKEVMRMFKIDPTVVRTMRVSRKVPVGAHGSVKELKRYGANLVAVRYRVDGKGGFAKTIEIVVDCQRRTR